jgi:hypothetical protein
MQSTMGISAFEHGTKHPKEVIKSKFEYQYARAGHK